MQYLLLQNKEWILCWKKKYIYIFLHAVFEVPLPVPNLPPGGTFAHFSFPCWDVTLNADWINAVIKCYRITASLGSGLLDSTKPRAAHLSEEFSKDKIDLCVFTSNVFLVALPSSSLLVFTANSSVLTFASAVWTSSHLQSYHSLPSPSLPSHPPFSLLLSLTPSHIFLLLFSLIYCSPPMINTSRLWQP